MPSSPRILAFAGSVRRESFNRKLLAVAVRETRAAGAEVTHIELKDYPLPLVDADLLEASGLPENARKLIALILDHHALLIASPEYNGLITPLMKNTIDWCSLADQNPLKGRIAAVVSASPGPFGGVRSALVVRGLLMKLGCHVVPAECTLARADQAFDEAGQLTNSHALASIKTVAAELVRTTAKLIG